MFNNTKRLYTGFFRMVSNRQVYKAVPIFDVKEEMVSNCLAIHPNAHIDFLLTAVKKFLPEAVNKSKSAS